MKIVPRAYKEWGFGGRRATAFSRTLAASSDWPAPCRTSAKTKYASSHRVYDETEDHKIVLLTNHRAFAASTITAIYKELWAIETFFKTMKQHLRIKIFVGASKNAVMVQLWTALIAILLLKYIKMLSSFLGWTFSMMVALLHLNLFTHRDLRKWINDPMGESPFLLDDGQLAFPGFGQQTEG